MKNFLKILAFFAILAISDQVIGQPFANDVGVTRISPPSGNCGLPSTFNVRVRIRNFGTQVQSNIPISYRVNNGAPVSQVFSGILAPNDTVGVVFSVPYSVPNSGNFRFDAWTFQPGDQRTSNDSTLNSIFFRAGSGFVPNGFSDFTGSNLSTVSPGWRESSGLNTGGTSSLWTSSATAQTTALGTTTARVNLFNTTRKEWIICPPVNLPANSFLKFKIALTNWNTPAIDSMGSDDSLIVKISTDCGISWANLKSFTRDNPPQNSLSQEQLSLSNYENQNVLIGFYGTDGSVDNISDYDIHIDDVEVLVPQSNDLSVLGFQGLNASCPITSPLPISVRVFNNGTQSQSSIPVSISANGQIAANQTFNQIIAPGQTVNLTFSSPITLGSFGTINLSAFTTLSGDGNAFNDTAKIALIRPNGSFLPMDFTGFTGANLTTLFPQWSEATGTNPGGTTSAWTSSVLTQTNGLGSLTARINLLGNTKRDWIISQGVTVLPNAVCRFRLALTGFGTLNPATMGSDDSLVVKVSTNCGQTWVRAGFFTAASNLTNVLTTYTVPLTYFAGNAIRLGFFATEGTINDIENYDLHIDKIEVYVPQPNDAEMQSVVLPNSDCGLPASFALKVNVYNNGTQAITSLPVFYQINNQAPLTQTFTQTISPGQTAELTFTSPVSLPNSGTFRLATWINLSGDGNLANDSVKNILLFRPGSGFLPMGFTDFTGSNLSTAYLGWGEATGVSPSGTTSAWANSSTTQTNALGSVTARINLFSNSKKDWILSQAVVPNANSFVRFKIALTNFVGIEPDSMGSDDTVAVRVTTNCGTSWTSIKVFTRNNNNLTNSLTVESLPLSAFAGQTIRIGFYASEGIVNDLPDYDIHLDDIEVYVPSPNDLALQTLLLPNALCGAGNIENVRIRVLNNGSQPQNSFTAGYALNGGSPVEETFNQSLNPGQSAIVSFTTPITLPNPGNYTLSAWTKLTGDGNPQNDSALNAVLNRPGTDLSPVNFTGFTGTNLSTLFPGWREQTGTNPSGTTSTWTSSSVAQTTAFGSTTARLNLFGNTKRDWIISAPFSPTTGNLLKFKIAVCTLLGTGPATMGSDDSLVIRASTNCGQTWIRLASFTSASNLTNQMTEQAVFIGFANQNVIIGFCGTAGLVNDPQDYDVLIDDILISQPPANDLGVTDIIFPSGDCGAPLSLNVKVRVANLGSNNQSNFPISYQVDNQPVVTETFSGNLGSGQSVEYTFAPTISLTQLGNYYFSAWTSMSNDLISANDSVKNKRLTRNGDVLVQADFNSFNGSNLGQINEGWYEATGQSPVAGNATWVNSTGSQTSALGSQTARINMNSNSKRDWIITQVVTPIAASNLKFRMAVTLRNFGLAGLMGSDDSVNVMISTNCGLTWIRERAFTAASSLTNSLQDFTVPLAAYAGQPIRIGFKATEGTVDDPQDFDFHLDNVFVSISTENQDLLKVGDLKIFPNPTKNFVNLLVPENQIAKEVEIINSIGQSIQVNVKGSENSQSFQLDLTGLAPGIYQLRLKIAPSSKWHKLVIE
jgi:hypothetical protein